MNELRCSEAGSGTTSVGNTVDWASNWELEEKGPVDVGVVGLTELVLRMVPTP